VGVPASCTGPLGSEPSLISAVEEMATRQLTLRHFSVHQYPPVRLLAPNRYTKSRLHVPDSGASP